MFRAVRWLASCSVTMVALYAYFFVPISGTRTLWDHTRLILGTPEAHALGDDLRTAGTRVATKIRREVIPSIATGFDGGRADDASAGALAATP